MNLRPKYEPAKSNRRLHYGDASNELGLKIYTRYGAFQILWYLIWTFRDGADGCTEIGSKLKRAIGNIFFADDLGQRIDEPSPRLAATLPGPLGSRRIANALTCASYF